MLFNSIDFVLFFAVVYGLYLVLRHRAQNWLLLGASYFFYGCWDWRFLSLILISTLVDYVCGLKIHEATRPGTRRGFLVLSMVSNLGLLFFFKYFGFFAESAQVLFQRLGMELDWVTLHFVLPVGISFYTFQTMSYTIDIYRRELKPTRDLLDFAVFVAFFPQLVAGPIERARHLLPQVQLRRVLTYPMIREGCWLILLGYFKKVVIADNMAPLVATVFDHPDQAYGLSILAATVAFAFQIYGDFSGYTDIARGISKLMGFDIMLNFRMPYFALNPQDFWKRWHISLSTWLRDYLYIPLGGNRGGTVFTYRNLTLTMLLGGLWHGAAWHFVAWGAYHGLLLVGHRLLLPILSLIQPTSLIGQRVWHWVRLTGFFGLTCFGWMLFRVESLADVPVLLSNIVQPFAWNGKVAMLTMACLLPPLLILDYWQEKTGDLLVVKRWPAPVRLATYATLFAFIVMTGWVERIEFIYFQF
ncbi:MAG TPA: MBOAT family O-acyltransferase [Kiritimatiellia bacterium]|nr:MBOAT family O-acyltransferase [Kiritimatiellia bacterium]